VSGHDSNPRQRGHGKAARHTIWLLVARARRARWELRSGSVRGVRRVPL